MLRDDYDLSTNWRCNNCDVQIKSEWVASVESKLGSTGSPLSLLSTPHHCSSHKVPEIYSILSPFKPMQTNSLFLGHCSCLFQDVKEGTTLSRLVLEGSFSIK